jgi:hypothetical protein
VRDKVPIGSPAEQQQGTDRLACRTAVVLFMLPQLPQLLSCSCCPSGDKPHVTKVVKEEADGANQGSVGQWGWVPDSAVLLFGQVLCMCPPMWLVQLGVRPPFCTCACVACCSGPACSASLVRTGAAHRGVSAHSTGDKQGAHMQHMRAHTALVQGLASSLCQHTAWTGVDARLGRSCRQAANTQLHFVFCLTAGLQAGVDPHLLAVLATTPEGP